MNTPLLERTGKRRIPRKYLIGIATALVLALAAGLALPVFIRARLPYDAKDYERAREAGDDDRILEIYHALRQARSAFPDKKQSDRIKALDLEAAAVIKKIEQDAGQKSRLLISSAKTGGRLSDDDINWMELFAPVAGREMTGASEETIEQYLSGKMAEEDFRRFIGEMIRIPLLSREFQAIEKGIETVNLIKELLGKAETARVSEDYNEEIKIIQKILSDADLSGLESVSAYLSHRHDRAWQDFYREQIVLIRQEMAHRKTYDASIRINRLLNRFSEDPELLSFKRDCDECNPESVVTWWDPVEHLAVKPLIADPGRAFDGDRYQAAADQNLLLGVEFERTLEQLYERNYVLVDSRSFATREGTLRSMPCPAGKKPIVLVLEDFYSSFPRAESGVAWRLDLNSRGQVEGVLLDRDGSEKFDRSFTAIGILEAFIERHPDFSFNGATGVIALVGQNGIFGYPVADVQDLARQRGGADMGVDLPPLPRTDFSANREKVRAIVSALESRNWKIASGTYNRLSLPFVTVEEIRQDITMTEMWVEPYTGKLSALYCPFGDHIEADPDKTKIYTESGYMLQSGYGAWPYWHGGDGYVYVSRTFLSGAGLRQPRTVNLERFLDAGQVMDRESRPLGNR
ncbi:MAG TPA: hypothetical protein PK646_01510 [Bacillota bacterium]|jgi:hypothetical protein|nr:hypothetical protein [Fastidiosipila sp.]HPX92942.1 hypothetical protein [Bacillota bacterium]HQB80756.1 hypothetical protein [Bacillota bacterium]